MATVWLESWAKCIFQRTKVINPCVMSYLSILHLETAESSRVLFWSPVDLIAINTVNSGEKITSQYNQWLNVNQSWHKASLCNKNELQICLRTRSPIFQGVKTVPILQLIVLHIPSTEVRLPGVWFHGIFYSWYIHIYISHNIKMAPQFHNVCNSLAIVGQVRTGLVFVQINTFVMRCLVQLRSTICNAV